MNLPDSSQSSSNRIIFSILLVLGFTFLGLYAGGGLSGMLVEKQNLDGMLDALGYILGGAVIGFGISLILSFKLNGKSLRRLSIVSFLIAAVISVFVYLNFAKAQQARLDPESEYENIAAYSVSLEQIVIKDPYLRVKMEVDSPKRQWISTGPAPDHQKCQGTIRAKQMAQIAKALETLAENGETEIETCRAGNSKTEQLLKWKLHLKDKPEAFSGELKISAACLKTSPAVNKVVFAVGRATFSPTSEVTCE